MYRTRVKICCISSIEEAQLAIRYGASAIGLVSAMPSGPGQIPEELIAEIARKAPPGIDTFLLTCKQTAGEVIDQQRRTKVRTIQLVDRFPIEEYAILKSSLPGIRIVQVIHVRDNQAIEHASAVAPHIDALLLDS
ncbi:MAG TPA: phosphoribosylanthranilate isomerase, partial [Bacteroidota bacterium]|nr:phosphoribosylanthranilate isomerase [Bacteroidota bacterium]